MLFRHASAIWRDYPQLSAGALHVRGIHRHAGVGDRAAPFLERARQRLAGASESDLPEIQAWRRAFASMGIKPTQYRCASEALLRRLRKEGSMPPLHPLIELCNAVSMAYAIPVAVLDAQRLGSALEVRYADGTERYLTFGGDTEHPEPGEVTYADPEGRAHARRWTNRQSGLSAVHDDTREVLIVAEALHDGAARDVARLTGELRAALAEVWQAPLRHAVLDARAPEFEVRRE
ncbi:B3/4 domain-containing protein [Achromobacter xylosoxidans]|uniref:B3/B4 domain-containing protein n=1 Tax=Alcaligenes xylosoxydans xylosoxydans TaxID=85698 RepID=UPI0022B8FBC2|nr:phenylalanine--tRNA ligase beta subunit-related protein [Achromobacter xylosoxidans]MCZ8439303.1 phenylalanine--tRNA ligase beta subunit-related protein [Achromobacter xylosoxidans]